MSVENRGLVLVAEDEKPIADLIGMYLRRDGFGVEWSVRDRAARACFVRVRVAIRTTGDRRQERHLIAIREHGVVARELAIHRDAQATGKFLERRLRRHQQLAQRDDSRALGKRHREFLRPRRLAQRPE